MPADPAPPWSPISSSGNISVSTPWPSPTPPLPPKGSWAPASSPPANGSALEGFASPRGLSSEDAAKSRALASPLPRAPSSSAKASTSWSIFADGNTCSLCPNGSTPSLSLPGAFESAPAPTANGSSRLPSCSAENGSMVAWLSSPKPLADPAAPNGSAGVSSTDAPMAYIACVFFASTRSPPPISASFAAPLNSGTDKPIRAKSA